MKNITKEQLLDEIIAKIYRIMRKTIVYDTSKKLLSNRYIYFSDWQETIKALCTALDKTSSLFNKSKEIKNIKAQKSIKDILKNE